MSIQKNKPEQIVAVLRQIEVQMGNGKTAPQACKEAGIHTQTYYRWRKEYGGLKVVQAKRLKELEKENTRPEAVGSGACSGEAGAAGCSTGKLLSPERRRCAVERAWEQHGLSERHACRLLRPWRGDTTIGADSSGGRGCSDPSDHCPGSEVRAIWLPEDRGTAAGCRLASGQGSGAADLAAGGAESAAKTKAAKTAVAERRFLCTTEAGATEPRLELRLHGCQNARGENAAAADLAG